MYKRHEILLQLWVGPCCYTCEGGRGLHCHLRVEPPDTNNDLITGNWTRKSFNFTRMTGSVRLQRNKTRRNETHKNRILCSRMKRYIYCIFHYKLKKTCTLYITNSIKCFLKKKRKPRLRPRSALFTESREQLSRNSTTEQNSSDEERCRLAGFKEK